MFKTKEEIIEVATEHTHEDGRQGFPPRRQLKLYVFPYEISIVTGTGTYCTPMAKYNGEKDGHPWEDYEKVEMAIGAPCGNSDNMSMLGSSDIYKLFGEDIAQHCEGWTLDREEEGGYSLFESSSVMPYISWDNVVKVVNAVKQHTPDAKDQI